MRKTAANTNGGKKTTQTKSNIVSANRDRQDLTSYLADSTNSLITVILKEEFVPSILEICKAHGGIPTVDYVIRELQLREPQGDFLGTKGKTTGKGNDFTPAEIEAIDHARSILFVDGWKPDGCQVFHPFARKGGKSLTCCGGEPVTPGAKVCKQHADGTAGRAIVEAFEKRGSEFTPTIHRLETRFKQSANLTKKLKGKQPPPLRKVVSPPGVNVVWFDEPAPSWIVLGENEKLGKIISPSTLENLIVLLSTDKDENNIISVVGQLDIATGNVRNKPVERKERLLKKINQCIADNADLRAEHFASLKIVDPEGEKAFKKKTSGLITELHDGSESDLDEFSDESTEEEAPQAKKPAPVKKPKVEIKKAQPAAATKPKTGAKTTLPSSSEEEDIEEESSASEEQKKAASKSVWTKTTSAAVVKKPAAKKVEEPEDEEESF